MTANVLFSQAITQTHAPEIERGMTGGSVQNRSAVSKTYAESSEGSPESFLNSLEQISRDLLPTNQTQGGGGGKSSISPAYNSGDKFAAASDPATGLVNGISETTKHLKKVLNNEESQITPASNLSAVISILESVGLYNSTGGSSSADIVDEISGNTEKLADLKILIARLGKKDFMPSAEMKAELDRLQQFITNTQTGNASAGTDGNHLGEFADSRSAEPDNLNQSAENSQAASASENPEKSDSIKLAVAARSIGVEPSENAKEPRPYENAPTGASGLRGSSDTPGKTGAPGQVSLLNRISSTIDSRKQFGGESAPQNLPISESSSVQKMTNDAQTARALSQGQRYTGDAIYENSANNDASFVSKKVNDAQTAKALSPGQRYSGDAIHENRVNNDASFVSRIANHAQALKTISQGQGSAGETVQDNTVNTESSPVSKMIHNSQLAKENHMRMDAAMNDESGGKITKVDTGANVNGLSSSQNQTAEKAFEATSQSGQTDTGQDSLRTHTLDQIVRKAVFYMRNGQHEARINLKPDFLGHVRMQVTTENHQVTVKILTESGFVKDMVENSIHQLKTDLQQQGLNVDKLEVAVSSDSDDYKHSQEKAGQAKNRQHSDARSNPGNREGETPEQTGNSGLKKTDTTTVDYFA